MMKSIIHFLKTVLLILTPFLLFPFILGLSEKIKHPTFKNLPISNYVVLGIILLVVIIIDISTIKALKKRKNKK
jgi:hypothetical protein